MEIYLDEEMIEILDLSSIAFHCNFILNQFPDVFLGLLEWLHCNEILDLQDNIALELFKQADKYTVPKLKAEAEKCLVKILTLENILERAKLAIEYNARDLEEEVVKFVARELDKVTEREELFQA